MAWTYQCALYITLFQLSVHGFGTIHAPALLRSQRSTNQKTNGSYKIINRYGKPFVNKPVPDGSVVFPGLTSRSGEDISLVIPEECKRLGICDKPLHYKDDLVESVIKDFRRRNKTFHSDVLEPPQLLERIGPDEENVELCTSVEKLYTPTIAQDVEDKWHRVINSEESPQQKFRVEICTFYVDDGANQCPYDNGQFNGPCSSIVIFQEGYQARCVQKYVYRHMVALNAKDEVIEKPLKLPSCCTCVARTV